MVDSGFGRGIQCGDGAFIKNRAAFAAADPGRNSQRCVPSLHAAHAFFQTRGEFHEIYKDLRDPAGLAGFHSACARQPGSGADSERPCAGQSGICSTVASAGRCHPGSVGKSPEAQSALHTIRALQLRVPQAKALPDPTVAVGWQNQG